MFRMGLSVDCALMSPGNAFACPGVVTATTPSLPVMRDHDSAMCTAACSWRQSMSRKSSSYSTSSRGRMWSPARVKIVSTPSSRNARVMICAPLTGMRVPLRTPRMARC